MEQSKKFKAKYFTADMEAIRASLYEATKEQDVVTLLQEDERNTRIELVKQDDDKFFITINREKLTGIPVRYNKEDIAGIDIPDGDYLGELYYALIDEDVIVAVSALGVSLQSSLEEALYRLTDTENKVSITPELDTEMYDKFKLSNSVRSVDFKLSFLNDEAVRYFLETPIGSNFAHWFDYCNISLDMKLTCGKNRLLDKEIYTIVDGIIRESYCTRLKVKFLGLGDEIIEANLLAPKIEYVENIYYDDYLKGNEAVSFLNRALHTRQMQG